MNEMIIVAIVMSIYFVISYFFHGWLSKAGIVAFILSALSYLGITYLFLVLIAGVDEYLSFSLTHADSAYIHEIVMAAFFVCPLTAIVNIIAAMAGHEAGKTGPVQDASRLVTH